MYERFRDEVFPFIKSLGQEDGLADEDQVAYVRFMKDAVFVVPKPSLFERAVTAIDAIPMQDRDTKGDLYEYLLSKLTAQGRNGQFRTPRHIIAMMVSLLDPGPQDVIGDPACGTCGFLVEAGEYLRGRHPEIMRDAALREHFTGPMFYAADFDASMLRIGAMNLMLHGIESPRIRGVDSLSKDAEAERDVVTKLLANPPFKGSLDADAVATDLSKTVKTKKTELLFGALFLKQLKVGGQCACIVPDGVLFGSSKAHRTLREQIVEGHKLDGVVSMPSGVFKPYAGVSTAVLIFTRTDSGGTDHVWFYDMQADGFSLDDKREPVEPNDIPDLIESWGNRDPEADTDRKEKAFFVPKEEIAANKYDLSINRYKEIVYEEVEHDPPEVILDRLEELEDEIRADIAELRGMLA